MVLEEYQTQIERNGFRLDKDQAQTVSALNDLAQKLDSDTAAASMRVIGWQQRAAGINEPFGLQTKVPRFYRLFQLAAGLIIRPRWQAVPGCYIWGGVGRGKTWIMDMFYHSLAIKEKTRHHYGVFMQEIHNQLSLEHRPNPLQTLARNMAGKFRVICLDEFHVSDITDAMLLHGLLRELFHQGVTLVLTSNQAPDELYKNGLQRDRFLPAIELIKSHTQVIHLNGDMDYRVSGLRHRPSYFINGEINHDELKTHLSRKYPPQGNLLNGLEIAGRSVPVSCLNQDCVWFDFDDICGDGRATSDYIFIASHFECVVVTNVPLLNARNDDMARRFIHFIDALYDAGTHLILGAERMPLELYQGCLLAREFKRTASRLQQMAVRHL